MTWTEQLAGRRVLVTTDEPWDFEPYTMSGEVRSVDDARELVLVECQEFTLRGGRFDALAGGRRHDGTGFESLVRTGELICNFKAWRLADALKDDAWKDWRKAPGPGTIGSIELVRD